MSEPTMIKLNYLLKLKDVLEEDENVIREKDKQYGGSWKKRGGVGAFMMLARKWDRLEESMEKNGYDIFQAVANDDRAEGLIDDIQDLRRYLTLVEAELRARGIVR